MFLACVGPAVPTVIADDVPQLGWRLPGDAFLRYGEGLETPHTRWARPSSLGTVKSLFLANKSAAYDVPELARRMDVEVHGMPSESWLKLGDCYWLWMWIASSTSSERAGHFERMLDQDYDVIVIGNYRFASLYPAAQYKILEKVANGTGLVMFYNHDIDPRVYRRPVPEAADQIARGIPFAGLEFYRNLFMPGKDLITSDRVGRHLLKAYTFGRGRVLLVDYNTQSSVFAAISGSIAPFSPYDYTAPLQYDYHMSLAARCVLWAAGRSPDFVFDSPFPDGKEISARAQSEPIRFKAQYSGDNMDSLILATRVRNRWNEVILSNESRLSITDGQLQWDFVIPPLSAGWHYVDMIVRSDQGVENWASFAVDVRSSLMIDALEPESSFHEMNEKVAARVVLSRRIEANESVELDITLEDGYGRVFSQTTQPVGTGLDRVRFEIEQGNLVAWGARVRVKLVRNGQLLHQDEYETRFRRPGRGEYPIAMWGAIAGYGNHIGNLQMRNLGFTAILADSPVSQARDDLGFMTFGAGTGALIHSLGDEIPVPCPVKGSDALVTFLNRRYESIDALNDAWETSFTSFEEAEPLYSIADPTPADVIRFHDSVASGEHQFAEGARKRRESIEEGNPFGVVGPEGSPVGDPELTLPAVTFWGPYLTVRDNLLVNAIAEPGILRGNWFGGYVEDRRVPTRLRHVLWLSILGGNNMIEYFTVGGGLLAPDLTRMPFTDEFMKSWDQLRNGLGPLLAKCRPAGSPVALYHSQPSQHVGQTGSDATDTIKVHEYMLNLLGDAGYSPQYVAAGQVKAGRLRQGDIKALFLLHAFALSDEEIDEIAAFVEQGGTVIADIPPAWFDDRCRLRGTMAMNEFFGISAVAPTASLQRRVSLMKQITDIPFEEQKLTLRGCDDSLNPLDGDSRHLIVQRHGKGRSILINGVIWEEGRFDPNTARALRALLENVAKVPRVFDVEFKQPLHKLGVKVYSYRRGDIWIDAVLPPEATDPHIPVVPHVTWPESRHTYDLRSQRYCDLVDHLETQTDRSSPIIAARLAYKVDRITISAPDTARPSSVLAFTCSVEDTEGVLRPNHVVRITVHNPANEECPYYGAILDSDGPVQSWRIPFALNDPSGDWRITATDIISGVTTSTIVRLGDKAEQ